MKNLVKGLKSVVIVLIMMFSCVPTMNAKTEAACLGCTDYQFRKAFSTCLSEAIQLAMYLENQPYGHVSILAVDRKIEEAISNMFFGQTLRKTQITVAIAYAIHLGADKFVETPFYKAFRNGEQAENYLLQKNTSKEEKKYLWFLQAVWKEHIRIIDLEAFPAQSYKKLSLRKIYKRGQYRYEEKFWRILAGI